ncbi:MAG: hypothetical protein HYR72_27090 [Deltaproteobacteria bacterium]|nr:hypothetical protein [Deltaproteobacteria bacterium]MBI3390319.1 hypothetical protein [Deltaproteobacteria bacterium]
MRLTAGTIQEFKDICQDEFGVSLSTEEAEMYAARVLELLWLLLVESMPSPHDVAEATS